MKKIKVIYTLAAILFCSSAANSQQVELKKPPIKKQEWGIKEMTVEGIKVLLKPSTKDIVSAALYVKGGTANCDKSQEGIEELTMSVLAESGSQKYPKDKFNALLDSYGTTIAATSAEDKSSVTMGCLKSKWNESWDIFADMIMHPAFDDNTFTNEKEQAINNTKQVESNPDGHLGEML